ncbi:Astra associated protein 1 Asa1 [Malassezia nana]|uniref:ASTRA-associated protein 1 n=1 Tax=Malassezia nana TaxID=180528 RepID=A0AAF0J250_9BASI|nr:Astra associated protein 1 Asa1 [Malassezia nana]
MRSSLVAAPTPSWIVRHHAPSPIHALAFANQGQDLIAGDAQGRVSISSLSSYRPHIFFSPHREAILRADVWSGFLVTHGRDNKVCVWQMPTERRSALLTSGAMTDLPAPSLVMEWPVNALNYCGYAMVTKTTEDSSLKAYMIVPHSLESAWLDVYELPTKRRLVEALGRSQVSHTQRPAIVMALQARLRSNRLDIVSGMEDGSVTAWSVSLDDLAVQLLWTHKPHRETVLAMDLAPSHNYVVSVGADASIVQISLKQEAEPVIYAAHRPGQASVSIRDDERIIAVGHWDGTTRVYARPDMEILASLSYHKESVQAVAFPRRDSVHTL